MQSENTVYSGRRLFVINNSHQVLWISSKYFWSPSLGWSFLERTSLFFWVSVEKLHNMLGSSSSLHVGVSCWAPCCHESETSSEDQWSQNFRVSTLILKWTSGRSSRVFWGKFVKVFDRKVKHGPAKNPFRKKNKINKNPRLLRVKHIGLTNKAKGNKSENPEV